MSAARTPPTVSFTAYSNYIAAIRYCLVSEYGAAAHQLPALSEVINQRPAYQRIQRRIHARSDLLATAINNAWQTELTLNYPRLIGDDEFSSLSIQWGTIQLYYTLFSAACAWLEAMQGPTAPKSHRAVLNALADHASTKSMFPLPWGAACRSCTPIAFCGETADHEPRRVNPLKSPSYEDALDFLCLALRRTRQGRLQEAIAEWKRQSGRRRVFQSEKSRLDSFPPTTLFDFLYRLRVRANYADAEFFRVATQYPKDAVRFHLGLCRIGAASLLLFEKLLVAAHGRPAMLKLAMSFLSQLSRAESTVGKRLPLW